MLAPLLDLASGAWDLQISSGSDAPGTTATSIDEWLRTLSDNPASTGRLRLTIDPPALDALGTDVSTVVVGLTQAALPIGMAAEAALSDPVQALVRGLLWDEARARSLIALAKRSRQLLFAGPPGTGKTLAARILANALADESRVRLVQFHPTYAYEDFVEGIRPLLDEDTAGSSSTNDGSLKPEDSSSGLRYEIRPGVFKQLVTGAQQAPSTARHFLIIDEMNRANLPRVLGELLFALEYRGPDNRVELAYSADDFYVPENVWIVGTMNTADRSVSLLDAAMRRRFKEVRFAVDYEVVTAWHERHTSKELGTEAAARLKRLNTEVVDLLDDDRAIGHSFLIRDDLAEVGFETVWAEDLEPVLRDHLLGRTDDLPALREAFLGTL
jgi:5-methylcytosine-specific restriction protein B